MPIIIRIDVMLAERKMLMIELAEKIGMDYSRLSAMKNGKAVALKIETIDNLCEALDCQPGDLLKYVSKKEYEKLMNK
jgi:putative transcriptional regulator